MKLESKFRSESKGKELVEVSCVELGLEANEVLQKTVSMLQRNAIWMDNFFEASLEAIKKADLDGLSIFLGPNYYAIENRNKEMMLEQDLMIKLVSAKETYLGDLIPKVKSLYGFHKRVRKHDKMFGFLLAQVPRLTDDRTKLNTIVSESKRLRDNPEKYSEHNVASRMFIMGLVFEYLTSSQKQTIESEVDCDINGKELQEQLLQIHKRAIKEAQKSHQDSLSKQVNELVKEQVPYHSIYTKHLQDFMLENSKTPVSSGSSSLVKSNKFELIAKAIYGQSKYSSVSLQQRIKQSSEFIQTQKELEAFYAEKLKYVQESFCKEVELGTILEPLQTLYEALRKIGASTKSALELDFITASQDQRKCYRQSAVKYYAQYPGLLPKSLGINPLYATEGEIKAAAEQAVDLCDGFHQPLFMRSEFGKFSLLRTAIDCLVRERNPLLLEKRYAIVYELMSRGGRIAILRESTDDALIPMPILSDPIYISDLDTLKGLDEEKVILTERKGMVLWKALMAITQCLPIPYDKFTQELKSILIQYTVTAASEMEGSRWIFNDFEILANHRRQVVLRICESYAKSCYYHNSDPLRLALKQEIEENIWPQGSLGKRGLRKSRLKKNLQDLLGKYSSSDNAKSLSLDGFDYVIGLGMKEQGSAVSLALPASSKLEASAAQLNQALQASETYLQVFNVPGDSDCFFHAVADQLQVRYQISQSVYELRKQAAQYLLDHKADFSAGIEALLSENKDVSVDAYIARMAKFGTWVDEPMVVALHKSMQLNIEITRSDGVVSRYLTKSGKGKTINLGYLPVQGLEHYVSLRDSQVKLKPVSAKVAHEAKSSVSSIGVFSVESLPSAQASELYATKTALALVGFFNGRLGPVNHTLDYLDMPKCSG